MKKCIFSCLSCRKSTKKQISIPSKKKDHGAYEVVKPIKGIVIEEEKTKKPIIDTQKKQEARQNGQIKEDITSDLKEQIIGSNSSSKVKIDEKQTQEQNPSPVHQALSDSSMSSLFSYPISNKYNNSTSKNDNHGFDQQESSDSLFSISVNSKNQSEPGEKEVNSPMKVLEWPEKEKKISGSNVMELINNDPTLKDKLNFSEAEKENENNGSNPCVKISSISKAAKNFTQLSKWIVMDEQEDKENITSEQEINIAFKSSFSVAEKENENNGSNPCAKINSISKATKNFTQLSKWIEDKENITSEQETNAAFKLSFSVAEKENENNRSNPCAKINSISKATKNFSQLSEWIVMDEQEDKENIKSEQEISIAFKTRSNFPDEIRIVGPNHGKEISSLLNPIENLTQWNTGRSERFSLMNDQGEKEKMKVPPFSSRISETKVKEAVLVDTSLSSWLVLSERESDSPESVKNSPERENNNGKLKRYNHDNGVKAMTMLTPQARRRRSGNPN